MVSGYRSDRPPEIDLAHNAQNVQEYISKFYKYINTS